MSWVMRLLHGIAGTGMARREDPPPRTQPIMFVLLPVFMFVCVPVERDLHQFIHISPNEHIPVKQHHTIKDIL